jgi:hypothetical protein
LQEYCFCDISLKWIKGESAAHHLKSHGPLGEAAKANPSGRLEIIDGQRTWVLDNQAASTSGGGLGGANGASNSSGFIDLSGDAGDSSSISTITTSSSSSAAADIRSYMGPSFKNKDERQQLVNSQAAQIVLDNQPLRLPEKEGYRKSLIILRPGWAPPSRATTCRTLCAWRTDREIINGRIIRKAASHALLKTRSIRVPAGLHVPYVPTGLSGEVLNLRHRGSAAVWSADMWSTRSADSYLSAEVHILTSDFEAKTILGGFRRFDHRHTGVNLGKGLRTMLYTEPRVDGVSSYEGCVIDGGSDMQVRG